jgi:hypothetical protein
MRGRDRFDSTRLPLQEYDEAQHRRWAFLMHTLGAALALRHADKTLSCGCVTSRPSH